jgi:hypothetical protein
MKKINKQLVISVLKVLIVVVVFVVLFALYISIISDRKAGNNTKPSENEHVHVFNVKKEDDKFLMDEGNCQTETKYYFSCLCGEKGSDIFNGNKNMKKHLDVTDPAYSNVTETKHTYTTTCNVCEKIVEENTVSHAYVNGVCVCGQLEHTHVFDQERPVPDCLESEATCKKPAIYYYSCICNAHGIETFEYGEKVDHKYETEEVKHSTCEATGITKYTCITCGDSYDQTIPTYGHMNVKNPIEQYKASDATCISKATYYYVCTACGEKSTDTYEVGNISTEHKTPYEVTYKQSSTSVHVKIETCTLCNQEFTSYETHTEEDGTCTKCGNHNHIFINENQDIAYLKNNASCLVKETYFKTCSCGEKGTETFTVGEFAGHNYVEKASSKFIKTEATCINKAIYYKSCSVCEQTDITTFEYGSALGHFETKTLGYEATCTTNGRTDSIYCERCKQTVSESVIIPATGHNEVIDHAVSNTCTSAGKTEGSHCSTCNKILKKQEIIPAGHIDTNNDRICDRCNSNF